MMKNAIRLAAVLVAVGMATGAQAALDCPQQAQLIRQAAGLRDQGINAQQALRQLNQGWQAPQASFRAVNQAWQHRDLTPSQLSEQVLESCVLALKEPESELAPLPITLSDCRQARQQQQQAQNSLDLRFELLSGEQKNLDERLQRLMWQQNSLNDSDPRAIEAFNREQRQYDIDLGLYRRQKTDFMQSQSLLKYQVEQWVNKCNSNSKP